MLPDSAASADKVLDEVASLCPGCGERVKSLILERDGKVYQQPQCAKHEFDPALIFSDAHLYRRLDAWNDLIFPATREPGAQEHRGAVCDCNSLSVNSPTLAVVDVTNRCNFRCPICFAETNGHGNYYFLDPALVTKMLQALLNQPNPCRNVQFSGGEPTLHPEFPKILRIARDLGFTHIQVATNGSRFVNPDYVRLCEESGLHTLYLQFDGMTDDVYLKIRGQRLLANKIRAVENVTKTNMRVVLVPVIVSRINVDQIGPIFRFALEHSKHITGISIQPAAFIGRVEVPDKAPEPFNLAMMAREFGKQTGLTRFPGDWFPLNAISMISRAVGRIRRDQSVAAACDAHCSLGAYFHIDEENQPHCITRFLDLDSFFRGMAAIDPGAEHGAVGRHISRLKELRRLSRSFDSRKAPKGLTFQRLLRGLDGWEDKTCGRAPGWFRRGFNGMFVAGMHFMDAHSYNFRRLNRCIIQYVTTKAEVIPFCSYNAGVRYRDAEELTRIARLSSCPPGPCGDAGSAS